MPIAQRPTTGGPAQVSSTLRVRLPSVFADPLIPLVAGMAVSIIDDAGVNEYRPSSATLATGWPMNFAGFVDSPATPVSPGTIITGRGSLVNPIIEGAGTFIPGNSVYLSLIPGEVTQTAVSGHGLLSLRVGYAINATQMILSTDSLFVLA